MTSTQHSAFNQSSDKSGTSYGLTKHEYLASAAMQGLLSDGYREIRDGETEIKYDHIALVAVRQADALIAALNAEQKATT